MTTLKTKTEKLLVKRGNNVELAKKMVNQLFDEATKFYPEAKASFLADYIRTVY